MSNKKRDTQRQSATEPSKEVQMPGQAPADEDTASSAAAAPASPEPSSPASTVLPASPVPEDTPNAPKSSLSIVGIGTSAGGLQALEQFFRRLPPDEALAFVIVQHLDPDHEGMLVELIGRHTKLPVQEAVEGQAVESGHIYIIPPGKDLSILGGVLHLVPQATPRGLHLPIDFFFRSLAEDQQERSIGVILSGMGTDGTHGLRAIKEKAGAAFVQSMESAKFNGMPRSAIEAGLADVVAPVEDLPGRIIAYRRHAPQLNRSPTVIEERAQSDLEKVFGLLRAHTGSDFSSYKKSTIYRRIERRMGLHQIDSVSQYVRYLDEHAEEIDLLFKELLIGVTCFFRDAPIWDHLRQEVMPALLSARSSSGVLRAWVPGCSTGEEAYSLAMVFKEAMDPFKPLKNVKLQIFATDLDQEAIDKARHGYYPDNIAADVSPERLRRFFVQDERGFRISKEIREMAVFAPQNIIMDPPFTKLDILSCRNLLIYLSSEVQKKLIPLFHYSLNPGGVLFLGSAETVGSFTSLFASLDGRARLYRRLDHALAAPVDFPSSGATAFPAAVAEADNERGDERSQPAKVTSPNLQALVDHILVQRFSPVGILCNEKGTILYISGRTGKYLEPSVGKANLNIFAMAREGLRFALSNAFASVIREERPAAVHGLKIGTNGGTQIIDLTVRRLFEPKELRGTILVVIADRASAPNRPSKAAQVAHGIPSELEQKLQLARDEIQTTREEMQTSQEELRSTNEELQSTNEELQSTNEELTTSKEEMQSLNEELQTVNQELQSKVDELSRSNNDMKNLLNSTDIATLFLDGELNVRRFTTPTARIIKLIPGDAGRPITDIASDLEYASLSDDAREVLRTLVFKEKQAPTRDGRWFNVRIMPYRTLDDVIDGVVITFTDASISRALELALREQASQLRQVAESAPNLVWSSHPDGGSDYFSRQWLEYTGVPEPQQIGFSWLESVHPDDRDWLRKDWRAAVQVSMPFELEFRLSDSKGIYRWFRTRSVPIVNANGNIVEWYNTGSDIDDLRKAEAQETQSTSRLKAVLGLTDKPTVIVDKKMVITVANIKAERIFPSEAGALLGKRLDDLLTGFKSELLLEDEDIKTGIQGNSRPVEVDVVIRTSGDRYKVQVQGVLDTREMVASFEPLETK